MTQITDPKKCTGCQACRLVCPEQCISVVPDSEGFQAPQIDGTRCTDCGSCASLCPENKRPGPANNECIKALGAKLKDDAALRRSASGGVFAGLALKVLEAPGSSVFGCAFDENIVAGHIRADDAGGIAPLQSSKYVQSDVGDTYFHAKALLREGKTVFYSGAPCQIAGLYAYLGRDYGNLLTADLICHGVPSPLLFRRYLDWLGRKHGGRVAGYNFRSKEESGWSLAGRANIRAGSKTKAAAIIPQIDPYYKSFLDSCTFRECCYTCRYAGSLRAADLTLGDFWGVEALHPEFYDTRGVSILLINTEKGERFFSVAEDMFCVTETTFEAAASRNRNLVGPSSRPALRDAAYERINDGGADFFKNPAYRIKTSAYIEKKARAGIKRLAPPLALELYRKIRKGASQ